MRSYHKYIGPIINAAFLVMVTLNTLSVPSWRIGFYVLVTAISLGVSFLVYRVRRKEIELKAITVLKQQVINLILSVMVIYFIILIYFLATVAIFGFV